MELSEYMTHIVTPISFSEKPADYYAFYFEVLAKARKD